MRRARTLCLTWLTIAGCSFDASALPRASAPVPGEPLSEPPISAPTSDPFGNGATVPVPSPSAPPLPTEGPAVEAAAIPSTDAGQSGEDVDAAAADAQAPDAVEPAPPVPVVQPGDMFAACSGDADCGSGLLCTVNSLPGLPASTGYCTALCNPTIANGCVQPRDGTVRAACSGALCVLQSCERAECPAGMLCERTDVLIAPGVPVGVFQCTAALGS